ncbi:MAG: glycosyltransferase, partial [Pyrinomonadaceae bacterium]|nr:glycosyltransferase [Pyrinomonadaceae bacterium]
QQNLLGELLQTQDIKDYFVWYYTPMALGFSQELKPKAVIFDCMDELSAFKNAPQLLKDREAELLQKADLVFTGGQSLYEAKKDRNPRVYAFPSSIDVAHFAKARTITDEPNDQKEIGKPRLGFFGVVDERFDIELLREISALRPDWNFVIVGPVVKIDENTLPKAANIHYLGGKKYDELPEYIAGWDVALLLFAINESTKFISPTKTPEYLAAGCPVVSTPIRDVARPYGDVGLVHIADTPEDFVQSCEAALNENREERLRKVDDFLADNSWDNTWRAMSDLITEAIENNKTKTANVATTGV